MDEGNNHGQYKTAKGTVTDSLFKLTGETKMLDGIYSNRQKQRVQQLKRKRFFNSSGFAIGGVLLTVVAWSIVSTLSLNTAKAESNETWQASTNGSLAPDASCWIHNDSNNQVTYRCN